MGHHHLYVDFYIFMFFVDHTPIAYGTPCWLPACMTFLLFPPETKALPQFVRVCVSHVQDSSSFV